MIQLHPDCLVLKTAAGDLIPCTTEQVTVELFGDAATLLDPEVIQEAARAILHYYRHELGRDWISAGEFSEALDRILRGFDLAATTARLPAARAAADADLRLLACESGKGCELAFFGRLRDALRRQLHESPQVVRFSGLRGCVKQLVGARRWSARCQELSDHIVEYLRRCLQAEERTSACAMMVQ